MIHLRNLSFEADGRPIFKSIDVSLGSEITALVGPNGAGKSLLASLIIGTSLPTFGEVKCDSVVAFFAQTEIAPIVTVESLMNEIWLQSPSRADWIHRLTSGLATEVLASSLSGGEWLRLRLARALARESNYLILDEPTNHLDSEGRAIVRDFVREWDGGMLLISHDRELLSEADQVLELHGGRLRQFDLSFEEYFDAAEEEKNRFAESLDLARREKKKAQRERIRLLHQQEKRMRWGQKLGERGGIPKILLGGMKRRAQRTMGTVDRSTQSQVDKRAGNFEELWLASVPEIRMRLDPELIVIPSGKLVMQLEDFQIHRSNREAMWKTGLNLTLRGPGRWSILGPNGSGKTLLLKALVDGVASLPAELERQGHLRRGVQRAAFLRQEFSGQGDLSIVEALRGKLVMDETELRNRLADYGFTGDQVFQKVATLSGGEKMRVALAELFLRADPPELLVLDEPTNNLDLANLQALEDALQEYPGAMLIVSHDDVFLRNLEAEPVLDLREYQDR